MPRLAPESRSLTPPRIDLLSTVQSVPSILCLVYAVKAFATDGGSSAAWAALAAGLLLGTAFVRRQLRAEHPLVDLSALGRATTVQVMAVLFLTAMLMGGTSLFANLYLQEVLGLDPLGAAVCMVPGMLAMMVAGVSGLISSVSLRRGFAVVGSVMALIVLTGIVTVMQNIAYYEGDSERVSVGVGLLSPWSLVNGLANAWDAGVDTPVPVDGAWVPAYAIVAVLLVGACLLGLVARFRKVGSR